MQVFARDSDFLEFINTRRLQRLLPRKRSPSQKPSDVQQSYRYHRPYFTYWVTSVQVLVCFVSLAVYGRAPLATQQSHLLQNGSSIFDQPRFDLTMNPWFGPYPADLIRLGAKYTPCLRQHDEVRSRYEKQARLESMSGCCIDSSTDQCMQTLAQQCLVRLRSEEWMGGSEVLLVDSRGRV